MEIRIGVLHQQGDLDIDTDLTADEISSALATAIGSDGGILDLADLGGKRFMIPAANIAYVVVGPEKTRRVGFGSL